MHFILLAICTEDFSTTIRGALNIPRLHYINHCMSAARMRPTGENWRMRF